MNNNPLSYNPQAPLPGRYVATIMTTYRDDRGIYIIYDIATGEHAGWATVTYINTGSYLLQQRIDIARGRQVLECLCHAAGARSVNDLAGKQVVMDLRYDDRQPGNPDKHHYHICRTYPVTTDQVHPDNIRVGTERWSSGSPDVIRAAIIAYRSCLPVLMVDKQERQSPMIDWCAEHSIAVLPVAFPAGDYTTPSSGAIIDRKQDINELYSNFADSVKMASYHIAAAIAGAMGKRLIYVVGTTPEDRVQCIDDLATWHGTIPGVGSVGGKAMHRHVAAYRRMYPHTDFVFIDKSCQCEKIWEILNERSA